MQIVLNEVEAAESARLSKLAATLHGRQFVLIWHPLTFDGLAMGAALYGYLKSAVVVTVPTTGTISREGSHTDKIVVLAAPLGTKAVSRFGANVFNVTFGRVGQLMSGMAAKLGVEVIGPAARHCAMFVYSDARTIGQEVWATAVSAALPHVPTMGGAVSGSVGLNGESREDGVVFVLLKSDTIITPLTAHPFTLGQTRTVVTKVASDRRQILELDGMPAVPRFLSLIGQDDDCLEGTPDDVGCAIDTHLGWMVGDSLVIRGVRGRIGAALELDAAVQLGNVLRLLRREPMLSKTLSQQVSTAIAAHPREVSEIWAASCGRFAQVAPIAAALALVGVTSCSTETQISGPVNNTLSLSGLLWGADD